MKEREKEAKEMFPYMLKSIRESLGTNQSELARNLGISRQMLAQWESGKTTPTKVQLNDWLNWCLQKINNLRVFDRIFYDFCNSLRREGKLGIVDELGKLCPQRQYRRSKSTSQE